MAVMNELIEEIKEKNKKIKDDKDKGFLSWIYRHPKISLFLLGALGFAVHGTWLTAELATIAGATEVFVSFTVLGASFAFPPALGFLAVLYLSPFALKATHDTLAYMSCKIVSTFFKSRIERKAEEIYNKMIDGGATKETALEMKNDVIKKHTKEYERYCYGAGLFLICASIAFTLAFPPLGIVMNTLVLLAFVATPLALQAIHWISDKGLIKAGEMRKGSSRELEPLLEKKEALENKELKSSQLTGFRPTSIPTTPMVPAPPKPSKKNIKPLDDLQNRVMTLQR